jgi:hypothetical protein
MDMDMDIVSVRIVKWAGGAVTAAAVVVLGVYFATVGLDKADKLASVLGAFIGVAGLALTIYGNVADRRSSTQDSPVSVHNQIGEGTFHGPVFQGRDYDHVDLTSSPGPRPRRNSGR